MLERCTFAVIPDPCVATPAAVMASSVSRAARQLEMALAARSALRYAAGYSMNLSILAGAY